MPRGISPFPPQGPPGPEEVQDVVAGRSPTGLGGLSFSDVAGFAQRAGDVGSSVLQGLRDPRSGGGALGFLGRLGRQLPAAYAAGQGNLAASAALQQNALAQEQAAVQQHQAQQMAQALAGLDPTNPRDVAQMAQVAAQYGDTATAIKLMDMLQSGELARMKAEQEAPKMRQIRDGDDVVHEQWDPRTRSWFEVGRGPVSGGVNINLGDSADQTIYQDVMEQTGDPFLAKSATENKAFRDPLSGLWVYGGEAEYGKAREYQGFVESLGQFMNLVDEFERRGVETSLAGEGVESVKTFFGEGSADYRRFQQARQELLTQYVKARSGAQVSDREISRYEAMFPKFRDMFEGGELKPGARAMLQGMLEAGEAMGRGRVRYEDRSKLSEIYYDRLGRRSFGEESSNEADQYFQAWEEERAKSTRATYATPEGRKAVREEARRRVEAAGIDPDSDDPRIDEIIDAYLEEVGLR